MTSECVVVSPVDPRIDVSPFRRVGRVLRASAVREVFAEASGRMFVAFESAELLRQLGTRPAQKHHRLLLESRQRGGEARRTMLAAFFRSVVAADGGLRILPLDELAEVLAAPNAANLAIAAGHDAELKYVYVIRGNLDRLTVPARRFRAAAGGPRPVLEKVRVIDHGNALAMGAYEASMDALLYEQDPVFRRELRKRQLRTDTSFASSIRRLRLQRGLRRTDIPGLSEKQVARIERGETDRPHKGTLRSLARALEVPVDELGDY